MKCFKVVRKSKKSSVVEGRAAVRYKVGEYVRAPSFLAEEGYHLTAFSSLSPALNFAEGFDDVIYEAQGKKRILHLPPRYYCWLVETPTGFSKAKKPDLSWPTATLMFKEIKLLKELK